MKVVPFVLLFVGLVGCSSFSEKSAKNEAVKELNSMNSKEAEQPLPEKVSIRNKTPNMDQIVKSVLPKGWEKERWFELIDNKNGFV